MKSGVLVRLVFLLFVLCLLVAGVVLARFQSWRSSRMVDLYSTSQVASTKSGPVEFLSLGDGPAVLVLHDAPGGFDQGAAAASFLVDDGFQIIVPSRPGYLRTPLAAVNAPENQADTIACLLETLDIRQVAVLGFGWAGPVALEFARRYPQKISAVVLVGSVVDRVNAPLVPPLPFPPVLENGFAGDFKSWRYSLLAENNSFRALHAALTKEFPVDPAAVESHCASVQADPVRLALFRSLALAHSPVTPRAAGFLNDLNQIRSLAAIPFPSIPTPVLFVHGAMDPSAPVASIEAAKPQFPNAEAFILPGEGHLVFLGAESSAATKCITSFLKKHTVSHGE